MTSRSRRGAHASASERTRSRTLPLLALPRRAGRGRGQYAVVRADAARRLARTRDLRVLLRLAHAHHRLEKRRADGRRVRLRQFRDRRVVALRQHAFLRRHGRAARGRGRRAVLAVSGGLSGAGGGRLVVLRAATRATAPPTPPTRRFRPTWHGALAFASAWAIGEWLRGTVFTGFPWLASGYAQVDGPFAGFAPVAGVYGVGWMLALVAALIVQAVLRAVVAQPPVRRRRPQRTARDPARASRARAGRVALALIVGRHAAAARPLDDAGQRAAHRAPAARQRETGNEVRGSRHARRDRRSISR